MPALLVNAASMVAEALPFTAEGSASLVVINKGTFDLRPGATAVAAKPQRSLAGDLPRGDPRTTALRYEADFVPFKPRADTLCVGNAYVPGGKLSPNCVVAFGVG